jgi:TolB-like protein
MSSAEMTWRTGITSLALAILLGCANPSYNSVKSDVTVTDWRTIAVTPFRGEQQYAADATDVFVIFMMKQNQLTVIEPSTVEIKAREVLVQAKGDILTAYEAQQVGQLVNADAVIIGSVSSHNSGATMNGFTTARLVDTKTGQVIAASHRPSGLLFGWSVHQAVMASTERVAKDILEALKKIHFARTPVPSPNKQNTEATKDRA